MWRKDGTAPTPPEPSGEPLCAFDRNRGKERVEVRLDRFEGNAFVSIRLWSRGQDGQLWPTKKGASIRLGELERLIAALQGVAGQGQGSHLKRDPAPAAANVAGNLNNCSEIPPSKDPARVSNNFHNCGQDPERPRYVEPRGRRPEPRDPAARPLPKAVPSNKAFDEFEGAEP